MMVRLALAVALSSVISIGAWADDKVPTAVDLLFNSRHLDSASKGDALNYTFERKVSDITKGGRPFKDDIIVEVMDETPEAAKNVKLTVFTGDRARPPFVTPGMTGNPLLLWYLDRSVASYRQVAGGSSLYLKGKFRDAIAEGAEVEPAKIKFDGKEVDAFKITLTPYANDPARSRMQGYENSRFQMLVSDQIPGFFYDMVSFYESRGKGTAKIEERVSLRK